MPPLIAAPPAVTSLEPADARGAPLPGNTPSQACGEREHLAGARPKTVGHKPAVAPDRTTRTATGTGVDGTHEGVQRADVHHAAGRASG